MATCLLIYSRALAQIEHYKEKHDFSKKEKIGWYRLWTTGKESKGILY